MINIGITEPSAHYLYHYHYHNTEAATDAPRQLQQNFRELSTMFGLTSEQVPDDEDELSSFLVPQQKTRGCRSPRCRTHLAASYSPAPESPQMTPVSFREVPEQHVEIASVHSTDVACATPIGGHADAAVDTPQLVGSTSSATKDPFPADDSLCALSLDIDTLCRELESGKHLNYFASPDSRSPTLVFFTPRSPPALDNPNLLFVDDNFPAAATAATAAAAAATAHNFVSSSAEQAALNGLFCSSHAQTQATVIPTAVIASSFDPLMQSPSSTSSSSDEAAHQSQEDQPLAQAQPQQPQQQQQNPPKRKRKPHHKLTPDQVADMKKMMTSYRLPQTKKKIHFVDMTTARNKKLQQQIQLQQMRQQERLKQQQQEFPSHLFRAPSSSTSNSTPFFPPQEIIAVSTPSSSSGTGSNKKRSFGLLC